MRSPSRRSTSMRFFNFGSGAYQPASSSYA